MTLTNVAGTEIFDFSNLSYSPADGSWGLSPIIVSNGVVFGTSFYGNTNDDGDPADFLDGTGTIYRMNADGTGYTNLYNFSSAEFGGADNTNGMNPEAGLVLASNVLYGTTARGGTNGTGTIFRINTDGTGFESIYFFSPYSGGVNIDGDYPEAPLVLCSNALYGTADGGGTSGYGTVFSVNTDGSNFHTLHNFTDSPGPDPDGAGPETGGLLLYSNVLYGTTAAGGSGSGAGGGIIFSVNTDGTDYKNLYNFQSDGLNPYSGLTVISNVLYGQTTAGGVSGYGTIFKINPDGTGFTTIFDFTNGNTFSSLSSSGNLLYSVDYGMPFFVDTNGSGFVLFNMTSVANYPGYEGGFSSLTVSGNTLYGSGGLAYGTGPQSPNDGILKFGPSAPIIDRIVYNTNASVTLYCSGTPYFTYLTQSTTNIAPPPVSWQTISTNQADANGNWQYTDYRPTNTVFGTFTNINYSGGPGSFGTNGTVLGTNVWSGYVPVFPVMFYRAAGPP